MTLYRETPCEHGLMYHHGTRDENLIWLDEDCPGGSREEVTREAIPWCTTHDQHADQTGWNRNVMKQVPSGCDHVRYSDECYVDIKWCVVSQGGPDPKWWKDT